MKRALAVILAFVGFTAFAQLSFTGKWTAKVCMDGYLTSTLSLTTSVAGFNITTDMGFGTGGLTSFKVGYKGGVGPFSLTGNMWFDPAAPAYTASDLSTSFDLAGLSLGLVVRHWLPGGFRSTEWYPDTDPCQSPYDAGMMYILSAKVDPFSAKLYLVDCCTGIEFYKAILTIKGIGLCCGIALDAELGFNKIDGFDYLTLTGINIPLCCGVSLDVAVTFEVDKKTVVVTPKFAGLGEGCFTVWGNPVYSKETNTWGGIEIYGYMISCKIADCNTFTIVHAFNRDKVNEKLASADRFIAACGEFELYKLTFCGPACCGGSYNVGLRIFFGSNGGIFDITRLVYSVSIPVFSGFTLDFSGTIAAASCATTSVCFGWTFTF